MRLIRDVRDDPAPPIDWRSLITRYPATFWLLITLGGQGYGRMMFLGDAAGAIGTTVVLALVGLPVAVAIDRWRQWRVRRSSAAQRVPEAERWHFPP